MAACVCVCVHFISVLERWKLGEVTPIKNIKASQLHYYHIVSVGYIS